VEIETVANRFGRSAATGEKIVRAIDTSLVPAIRKLSTAVVMEADITRIAAVFVINNDVDAFAIRSASGAAGAGGSTRGILAARYEDEARCSEEGKSDQKRAH
jgi:hypothetical protein